VSNTAGLTFLAFDLGAGSGRALVGKIRKSNISLQEVHRFPNPMIKLLDGLHWDVLYLFNELKKGLVEASRQGHRQLMGIGVDTWGVDFGLISKDNHLLGYPYTYRDLNTDGMIDCAFERVPRKEMLTILDVGCGTGLNSEYLIRLGHKVIGIDISDVAIKRYKARGFDAIRCDIKNGLSFNNESFDLVFASEVLEHLHDTAFFLCECYRVLKPKGILVLSTPNSAFWIYRVLCIIGKTISELQHPGHIRFFSKNSLLRYVVQAGFISPNISGRHMYIFVGDVIGTLLKPLLRKIGFEREYRFRTSKHFWHKMNLNSVLLRVPKNLPKHVTLPYRQIRVKVYSWQI